MIVVFAVLYPHFQGKWPKSQELVKMNARGRGRHRNNAVQCIVAFNGADTTVMVEVRHAHPHFFVPVSLHLPAIAVLQVMQMSLM